MKQVNVQISAKTGQRSITEVELAPEVALEIERSGMRCSRFQARAALHDAGLLEQAETAVQEAGGRTQIAWADATEFRRDSPTIASIADAMGLTDEQVDDLFRSAMGITA